MKMLILILIAFNCASARHFGGRSQHKSPKLFSRIVGGERLHIADFGWQVSLQINGRHMCGGSILNKDWILSAGHCFTGSRDNWSVRAGSNYVYKGGVLHNVAEIITHPDYKNEFKNDAALLRLETPLPLNDATIYAARLIGEDVETPGGSIAKVTGWGASKEGGSVLAELYGVDVPVIDNNLCYKNTAYSKFITESVICAGHPEGGKDGCQGDSGGPLVDSNSILIGIVSWGIGCARPDNPGVYTRLASTNIRDFIFDHVAL